MCHSWMAGKRFCWTSDDIRCYDGHGMTSMAGNGNENSASKETPEAGPSGASTTLSERPDTSGGYMAGSKRLFSTADPDYDHQPNTKRMRVMQQLAQDELNQRVVKVVDKVLHSAIQEKKAETEEIDARILRLQQCLHTLRYCISFSCYNDNKGEPEKSERQSRLPGLHPAVRRQMGKASAPPLPASEPLLLGPHIAEHKPLSPTTAQGEKGLPHQSERTSSHPGHLADMALPSSAKNKATAGHHPSESTSLLLAKSQSSTKTPEKLKTSQDKVPPSPQPLSPKHLPPLPPDNPLTIPQGRQRRLQSKRRLIVGNTYQYLTPVPGEETENTFRYKWQVYVRAPPGDPDLATFLQSVTFVLDQSYSPHHVINIKQPPFVLSRRGWGEFKIQIMLKFTDPRNKPARLLHPLVLSRPNDALALTGLWRLGQENWYDLWVYLPNPEVSSGADEGTQGKEEEEEEFCPASLTQELLTGVIVSKVEDNTTIRHEASRDHNGCSDKLAAPEDRCRDQCTEERGVTSIKVGCADTFEKSKVGGGKRTDIKCKESGTFLSAKDVSISSSGTKTHGDTRTNTEHINLLGIKGSVNDMAESIDMVEESSKFRGDTNKEKHNEESDKVASLPNGKVCKVYVRQGDGSLRPYLIPSHLYPLAVQAACSRSKQNKGSTVAQTNSGDKKEAKVIQPSVNQRLSGVMKDVSKTVKTKIISQQNVSSSSGSVVGVTGGASSVLKGNSQLDVEVTQESLVENQSVAIALVGGKKQLFVQGQKHIMTTTLKQATGLENSRISQVQGLSSQHSMNLGLGGSPIKVVALNQLQTGEIRFLMSNGQLLTLEKLKSLGVKVFADGGQKKIVTSFGALPPTTTTSVTIPISSTPAATTTTSTGSMLIQGEQLVAGSSKFKLKRSKDQVNLMQLLPLKLHCKKGSNIVLPMQSLLKRKVSPINIASQKSGGGGGGGGGGVSSLSMKNILLGTKKKEDEERDCSAYWEEYLGRMCEACSTGLSTPSCVSALLRLLPVIHPSHTPPLPFSFSHAASYKHFLTWPLAKQRACEFQRAREVRLQLRKCCINDWERWTVPRIVAWARGHAHTPVASRPVIHTDKFNLPPSSPTPGNSLSSVGNVKLEGEHQSDTTAFPTSMLEVDVVGLDEEEGELGGFKRKLGSPLKQQLEYLPFEEEMSSGCEWVGQLVSHLRLSLQPEEVGDGCRADVARAALWKATLNLMEDLLRSSYFQAWQESSVVPPPVITPSHVISALTHSRPEYDLFTELGLGTPNKAM